MSRLCLRFAAVGARAPGARPEPPAAAAAVDKAREEAASGREPAACEAAVGALDAAEPDGSEDGDSRRHGGGLTTARLSCITRSWIGPGHTIAYLQRWRVA